MGALGNHCGVFEESREPGEGQVTTRLLVRDPVTGKSQAAGEPGAWACPSSSEAGGPRSQEGWVISEKLVLLPHPHRGS